MHLKHVFQTDVHTKSELERAAKNAQHSVSACFKSI